MILCSTVVAVGEATARSAVAPASEVVLSAPKLLAHGLADYFDVVVADVSGDGRDDVVASGLDGRPRLVVYRQKADGGLRATPTILSVSQTGPLPVAAGDYDGDGDTDIAVGTDGGIDVFAQSGGTLTGPATVPSRNRSYELETADTNADGRDDLVVLEERPADIAIVTRRQEEDGSGFMPRVVIASAIHVWEVSVGDANGDGRDDILPDTQADLQRLYLQESGGSFSEIDIEMGEGPDTIEAGDVTSDGRPDLVASTYGRIGVRPGLADGSWGPIEYYGALPGQIALEDFDGNGGTDVGSLAGDGSGGGVFSILGQQADGTLAPIGCRFATPGSRGSFGDLDGDALTDFATIRSDGLAVQGRLAAGEHRDATLTARFVNNGDPRVNESVFIAGDRTVEDYWCKPPGDVEIWGAAPGGVFQRLADASWSGHPLSSTNSFAASVVVDRAGSWTFEARWDGGRVYGRVRSAPVNVEVLRAESWLGLEESESDITVGQSTTLTASLGGRTSALEGQPIDFFSLTDQGQTKIATVRTNDEGLAQLTVSPRSNTRYTAEFAGNSQAEPAASTQPLLIYVRTRVTGRMIRERRHEDRYAIYSSRRRVFFRTTVEPSKSGKPVEVYLYVRRSGRWRFVFADDYHLGPDSSLTLYAPGRVFDRNRGYRFQAVYTGDPKNLGAHSTWAYFKVE